jgi:hypothetical protein
MDKNIIKQEVDDLLEDFIGGATRLTLGHIVTEFSNKLGLFYDERDKLEFCIEFIQIGEQNLAKHILKCQYRDKIEICPTDKAFQLVISAAKQELQKINKNLETEPSQDDAFSSEEITDTSKSIDDIVDMLNTSQLGQEILFDEIQELKYHMNLGKKKWNSLVVGTVFNSVASGIIDKTIVSTIFENIDVLKNDLVNLLP